MAPSDTSVKKTECISSVKPKGRVNKPLIEKRRRERINDSLQQLHDMVTQLDRQTKIGRPVKLEKADILEMTVEYVKSFNSQEMSTKEGTESQYNMGYKRCVEEITKFFKSNSCVSFDLKSSVLDHIDKDNKLRTKEAVTKTKTEQCKSTDVFSKSASITSTMKIIQPKPSDDLVRLHDISQQTLCSVMSVQPSLGVIGSKQMPTYILVPTAALCQVPSISLSAVETAKPSTSVSCDRNEEPGDNTPTIFDKHLTVASSCNLPVTNAITQTVTAEHMSCFPLQKCPRSRDARIQPSLQLANIIGPLTQHCHASNTDDAMWRPW
ncbi:uncharacterized protein LOC110462953 [Mizuhopecten yessoensis]|uniref:Transcription factor HES-1-A n=1 Tax=Mizuhopecten yessoensis TaxID=6573 RepID=A0A210PX87_MIZYE|nr:uncharacterized protein LOC110462953 [Mizuhopecten yessoensis]OWF41095.1 Transcription factor HES-1-A [Mizuhopecten yessoensis]